MPFAERAARASVDGSDREIFNMDIKPSNAGLSKRSSRLHMLALCAVGLAINYLLAKVPLGDMVTDCYYVDDRWACVTWNGTVGYILVDNLGW